MVWGRGLKFDSVCNFIIASTAPRAKVIFPSAAFSFPKQDVIKSLFVPALTIKLGLLLKALNAFFKTVTEYSGFGNVSFELQIACTIWRT